MDENSSNGRKSPRISDEDLVHLLNTKKQKNREILSITNAAADAVYNHAQSRQSFRECYSNENYAENKENNIADSSDSLVATGLRDKPFHGEHLVRIPSRLLREIKSPRDRSSSEIVSTNDSKDTSSGSLFASQSSSKYNAFVNFSPQFFSTCG